MSSKKQKEIIISKQFGLKRVINSFKFSCEGLKYAYKYEQSMWLHAISVFFVVIVSFLLKLSFNQWALVILSSLFILSIELINTAVEATVDMVTKEYNEFAKIAKDCASAATFMAAIAHAAICVCVFADAIERLWFK